MSGSGVGRLMAPADRIEARIADAEKLRAALEEIKRLHQPMMMPGSSLLMLCDHCCFEDCGNQTADCAESHQHTAGGPGCATADIIARWGL